MNMFRIRLLKIVFLLTNPKYLLIFLRFRVVPSIEHLTNIKSLIFSNVIDVGANKGQFSLLVRYIFPSKNILSFEPLNGCSAIIRNLFAKDKNIFLYQHALSDKDGYDIIYRTKNNDSSSLLKPKLVTQYYPGCSILNKEKIELKTGSSIEDERLKNCLLKIDVQGSELAVLKGFNKKLRYVKYVLIEISELELYESQPVFDDVHSYLLKNGFHLQIKYNTSVVNSREIQSDYLYEKKNY